ncbi:Fur family transcriptional regulator [Desulfovibrio sp. TomC]|uniref:Fur family transcriptional regulator n=1 Tax=Desulfovibrio sp. TomC TaxID=1562888 RepID=UPI000574EB62|nr:transcriptional repressor [Desulfovibrio sp. TomC]KHK02714.1 Zinc uptake regulation protein ZUR [Desulfovibrio sp. TomC]
MGMDNLGTIGGKTMLTRAGIDPTPLRLAVAEVLAGEGRALPAGDILTLVRRQHQANKVTLYRILDLFVEKGLARRHSSGDRALRYCLEPGFSDRPHCHAYCVRCGRMECLPAALGVVDVAALGPMLAMDVMAVEVRIDGVCASCRRQSSPDGAAVDVGAGNS